MLLQQIPILVTTATGLAPGILLCVDSSVVVVQLQLGGKHFEARLAGDFTSLLMDLSFVASESMRILEHLRANVTHARVTSVHSINVTS